MSEDLVSAKRSIGSLEGNNDAGKESDDETSGRPEKVARVSESPEDCFWLDDTDVLTAIREIEKIQPAKLEVKHIVDFYKRFPNHPIVLSCLGDSMEKVCAGIDPECIADFLFQTKKGARRSPVYLRDVITALVESGVDNTTDYKGNSSFLPVGITGEDWGNAIGTIFSKFSNQVYCFRMGNGTTTVPDFVRLAKPLKKGRKCTVCDLVPLLRHLWMNPYLGAGGWTDEMKDLHGRYDKFVDSRKWLDRALDPGFIFVENPPAHAILAGWIADVPLQANHAGPPIAGVTPSCLAAAPAAVAGFSSLFRVADLEEARVAVLSLRNSSTAAAMPNTRFFAVNTRLGGCTHY